MRNDGKHVWVEDGVIFTRSGSWSLPDAKELLNELSQIIASYYDVLDCYHRALPGEPRFTLLGRDPEFAKLVKQWADNRDYDIACGVRPPSDRDRVLSARKLAATAPEWRRGHDGAWRLPSA